MYTYIYITSQNNSKYVQFTEKEIWENQEVIDFDLLWGH